MAGSSIKYQTFPTTVAPPAFVEKIVNVFRKHEVEISTNALQKGLTSDEVLGRLRGDLVKLGFEVESNANSIKRPVLFGENGIARVSYEIDAYHSEWQVVMERRRGTAEFVRRIFSLE